MTRSMKSRIFPKEGIFPPKYKGPGAGMSSEEQKESYMLGAE